MSSLLRDMRHSVRTLRQSPGFTAVAVLTLAIGIGANTAIFSFVDAMLLKPLPYPDADRIVRVMEKPPQRRAQRDLDVELPRLAEGQHRLRLHVGADRRRRHDDRRLGTDPTRGARCLPATSRSSASSRRSAGRSSPARISSANTRWRHQSRALGHPVRRRPDIVNRTVLLNNQPHTIVGVLPEGSAFDRAAGRSGGRWRSSRRT